MRSLLAVAVLLVPTLATASPSTEYEPGIVPEGMNAFIGKKKAVHASLLGTSQVTVGHDTELATYLLADVILFPNLRLERQLAESEGGALSVLVGAGAGALPAAAGFVMPFPGGAVAGGGVGIAWGSVQAVTLVATGRSPSRGYSISVNAGALAAEGGIAVAAAGVGGGGGGGGAAVGADSESTHRFGATAGVELDKTFGARDALVVAVDAWVVDPHEAMQEMTSATGLVYPRITWSHRFKAWQLTGGAYAMIDLPKADFLRSKLPVAPFFNVAWNH
jgi:hypothetical protein